MSTGTAGFRATAGIIPLLRPLAAGGAGAGRRRRGVAAAVRDHPLDRHQLSGLPGRQAGAGRHAPGGLHASRERVKDQLYKGFLTSLLNPKGMLVYLAILPQFMDRQQGNTTAGAAAVGGVHVLVRGGVFGGVRRLGGGSLSELRRRLIDGTAGGMILLAAGFMALAHR